MLRTYQRAILTFISILSVFSLVLFGNSGSWSSGKEEESTLSLMTGKPVSLKEVQTLACFLRYDREDFFLSSHFNLCNPGTLRREILAKGLADELVEAYMQPLSEGFAHSLAKVKRFEPYTHPLVADLSVKALWGEVYPKALEELEALKKQETVDFRTFAALKQFYLEETRLPDPMVRQILFREAQKKGPDPKLAYADLSLCGTKGAEDLFGRGFLELVAEFILKGAFLAEKEGYSFSSVEAKQQLIHQFLETKQQVLKTEELSLQEHLQGLGLTVSDAAFCVQRIELFQAYLRHVSSSILPDRLVCKIFDRYALERATLDWYEWPSYLATPTIWDLAKLQGYISSISPLSRQSLEFPTTVYSLAEVEKKAPSLVQELYLVKMARTPLDQIGLKAPLKEVVSWQLEEGNWEKMRKEYPKLKKAFSREKKKQELKNLDSKVSTQLERFARRALVSEHPEWVEEGLQKVRVEEKTLVFSELDRQLPQCRKIRILKDLLQKAFEGDFEAASSLKVFVDGGQLFSIELVEKKPRKILSFTEANALGVLDTLLLKQLSVEFKLKETQIEKAKETYAKQSLKGLMGKLKNDPKKRLLEPTKKQLSCCLSGKAPSQSERILTQFEMQVKEVSGLSSELGSYRDLKKGQFSRIEEEEGRYAFFYLKEKKAFKDPTSPRVSRLGQMLQQDASCFAARKILKKL